MIKKLSSFIVLLVLISCGSATKENFNINIKKTKEYLKNNDQIEFTINNPSNKNITNLKFKIDNNLVSSPLLLNNKLSKNVLKANFTVDQNEYTLEKEFVIYSSITPKIYTYKIINEFSHDMNSYTQGLEFDDNNFLYEGTGQYGSSMLKKVNFQSGEVLDKLFLDKSYFGEGITILNDKIFQLTWKSKIGFIYDLELNNIGTFNYGKSKEGWGLCNDGNYIYKSDGTSKIWRLDPNTLEEIDFIDVMTDKSRIKNINELEYIDGKIYANTYQQNRDVVIVINPSNGVVENVIDFSGLRDKVLQTPDLDVMNGIAYNKGKLFVTGKNWDKVFEVKVYSKN